MSTVLTEVYCIISRYVQERDASGYECQVSTAPKIHRFFNLAVVIPSVTIEGNREIHVSAGSPVRLRCVIKEAVDRPAFVNWYHDRNMLVSDGSNSRRR